MAAGQSLENLIRVARGLQKADLVIKNAAYLNVFTGEWLRGDIAIVDGRIAGIGDYDGETLVDAAGRTVVPGFIDGHIHLESAMIAPLEFARAVLPHGTTAVVADPHEIANVLGTAGIDYMLRATESLPMDVFFMIPSCVPATPFDEAGAHCLGVSPSVDPFMTLSFVSLPVIPALRLTTLGVVDVDRFSLA